MTILSSGFLIAALIIPSVSSQRPVSVASSNILKELSNRKQRQPVITPKALAAVGNELLEKRGFDYSFDVCEILPERDRQASGFAIPASSTLSLSNGTQRNFEFAVAGGGEGLCGECMSRVPAVQVTAKEMVLIADGKRYRVRRPSTFILDEAELVDAKMKKVLRKWQLPYQSIPIGISSDGAKLYLDFYTDYKLDDLVLELSENGKLAFRDRGEVQLVKGKWIEDHPKDPNNAYLSFIRFDTGDKTFIIRFSAPCT
jgi:hypothetical protein